MNLIDCYYLTKMELDQWRARAAIWAALLALSLALNLAQWWWS